MSEMQRFIIVGAGLAGWRAATELRRLAPRAEIHLFGDELDFPYDRPPLSKQVLLGEVAPPLLSDEAAMSASTIDFHRGVAVTKILPDDHRVQSADGTQLLYDALLLATGSRPRLLPGALANGAPVHYLRRRDDALKLRGEIAARKKLIVIGGGFIGLEVAAAAAMQGCKVSLFETAERLLARVAPAPIGTFVRQLHEAHGNSIVTSARIRRCLCDSGRVGIELGDGKIHWADVIVAGIGIIPNVELAVAAKLKVDDGIVVDASCRSSVPGIFAAGEVTRHAIAGYPGLRRIESWKTASEQPRVAARTMLGMMAEYDELPWAWSDQFDVNLQVLGFPELAVDYRLDGDRAAGRWCLEGRDVTGKIVAAFAVNDGRAISRLRRRFHAPTRDPQLLAGA